MTAVQALAEWPTTSGSLPAPLAKAWMRLRHFADDADLHEKDVAYFEAESRRLKESIDDRMAQSDGEA